LTEYRFDDHKSHILGMGSKLLPPRWEADN
jgi:hypothetical protein